MARTKPVPVKTKPSRYTPPKPKTKRSSPKWLPIVMFVLFGLGALVVVLNYMNLLPGEASTPPLLI
ncbi:MAG: cell division protein CrgA, partial [Acidimicrobiia bacterium]